MVQLPDKMGQDPKEFWAAAQNPDQTITDYLHKNKEILPMLGSTVILISESLLWVKTQNFD